MKLVAAKCPSCGANIEVDKNSDKTKCEFCNTQIIVDDAIAKYKVEISGKIEVDNLPKFNNYLKIGMMHYNDGEYDEAYKAYEKASELNPENYLIILRKGICKALNTNYLNVDFNILLNAIKNSHKICKKNLVPQNNINSAIKETEKAINQLKFFIDKFYKENYRSMNVAGVTTYINHSINCLDCMEFIYSIIDDENKEMKLQMIDSICIQINEIMKPKQYFSGMYSKNGKSILGAYKIPKNNKKSLENKRTFYKLEKLRIDPIIGEQKKENNIKIDLSKYGLDKFVNIFNNKKN